MREEDLPFRWKKLISRFTSADNTEKYGQIVINHYKEKHRFYHDINHLLLLLDRLDFALENIAISEQSAAIIELAIWYHDAIYIPENNDNELKSAELFTNHAKALNINQNVMADVKRLIMITENHNLASSLDEEIISDCDLTPLGLNRKSFDISDMNIRKEYPKTPEIERKKALEKFLQHHEIFKTTLFKNIYEKQALENIKNRIKRIN